ncbi:MAG: hypothetical protein OXE17_08760 [Chloroflexi bacterium]|nr:hypothetical protein [Chloroflexota bacterium]
MNNILEKDFVQEIANSIDQLGYQVKLEPSEVPNRKMWKFDPASILRGPKFTPDLLVGNNSEFAVIEAMSRPFLMGGIIDARSVAEYFGVPAIICVPDEVLPDIPGSVLRFADEENVSIAALSDLASTLALLLSPGTINLTGIE